MRDINDAMLLEPGDFIARITGPELNQALVISVSPTLIARSIMHGHFVKRNTKCVDSHIRTLKLPLSMIANELKIQAQNILILRKK